MKKIITALTVITLMISACAPYEPAPAIDILINDEVQNNTLSSPAPTENSEADEYIILKEWSDYVYADKLGNSVGVCLYIDNGKATEVAAQMKKIDRRANMNGYNWEIFLNYYLANNAPELLNGLIADPEAGLYSAYYETTEENEAKALKFGELIYNLIENEEEIYRIVKENSDKINWDKGVIGNLLFN